MVLFITNGLIIKDLDNTDNQYGPNLYTHQQLLTVGYIAMQSESHPKELKKIAINDLESHLNERIILNKLRKR